jgi:hypothetical protein
MRGHEGRVDQEERDHHADDRAGGGLPPAGGSCPSQPVQGFDAGRDAEQPADVESGYSEAPNGASRASSAKLIATMANVVMGRARPVIPQVCGLSVSEL